MLGAVASAGIDDLVGAGKANREVLIGHMLIDPSFEKSRFLPGSSYPLVASLDDSADFGIVRLDVGVAVEEFVAWTGGGFVLWTSSLDANDQRRALFRRIFWWADSGIESAAA